MLGSPAFTDLVDPSGPIRTYRVTYTSTFQQVSEMDALVDLKVAGGDLLEGPGRWTSFPSTWSRPRSTDPRPEGGKWLFLFEDMFLLTRYLKSGPGNHVSS